MQLLVRIWVSCIQLEVTCLLENKTLSCHLVNSKKIIIIEKTIWGVFAKLPNTSHLVDKEFPCISPPDVHTTYNTGHLVPNVKRRALPLGIQLSSCNHPLRGGNECVNWTKGSSSFSGCPTWHHVSAESSRDAPRVLTDDWASAQVCWWFPQLYFRNLWHSSCAKTKRPPS